MQQQIQDHKRTVLLVGSCMGGILIILYLCGVLAFSGKFLPGVSVNGRSIALRSPQEVTVDMISETGRHHLKFYFENGSEQWMTFSELGIRSSSDLSLLQEPTGSAWSWPISWLNPRNYEIHDALSFSRERIHKALVQTSWASGSSNMHPEALSVVRDHDNYRLVYAEGRRYLDVDAVTDAVMQALSNGRLQVDISNCYGDVSLVRSIPAVSMPGMTLNDILQMQLLIRLDNTHQEIIPRIVLQGACYEDNGVLMVRPSVMLSYLYTLGEKYDTVGKDRQFITADGTSMILQPSDRDTYRGYDLDVEQLLVSVLSSMSKGQDDVIQAPWKSVGCQLNADNDLGDTYLEISLSQQHLWYHQDGIVQLETDVVTGLPENHRETPVGLFTVRGLYRNYMMYYADGQALAEYFIQVTADGVGIHDSARMVYGGSIYKTAGSHGCVNIPASSARQLFEMITELQHWEIPVVIYA